MAYVQPDSKIYLLHNVPITNNYQHSICWKGYAANGTLIEYTPQDQHDYFLGFAKPSAVFNDQSYQRYKLGVIRVRASSEYLLDCNYLMFQNTHYGDKWFYAFITDVRYVNDNMTEVEYELDPIQTWYFETEFSMCGIERETTRSDGIGENIVPENLEIGKTMRKEQYGNFYDYSEQKIVVLCSKYPVLATEPELKPVAGVPTNTYVDKPVIEKWIDGQGSISPLPYPYQNISPQVPATQNAGRVYTGVYSLYLSLDRDLTPYPNADDPSMSIYYPVDPNVDAITMLQAFIQAGFEDAIVAVYQCPSALADTREITSLNPDSSTPFFQNPDDKRPPYKKTTVYGRPANFAYKYGNRQNYTPKNNKLYTSPYMNLLVSNNNGDNKVYEWEDFVGGSISYPIDANGNPTDNYVDSSEYAYNCRMVDVGGRRTIYYDACLKALGSCASLPQILLEPKSYQGVADGWDYGIMLENFPQCAWTGDTFKAWLAQNKWSLAGDLLGASAQIAFGVGRMANSTREVTRNIGEETLTSGVVNIAKMAGRIGDMSIAPDKVHGVAQANYLTQLAKRYKFSIYSQTIWGEYAEIIDNYFTMFGYAVNKLGTPDICQRLRWTYIKTVNANQIGSIPDDESRRIEQIYNNGITFWSYRQDMDIGNYSQTNTPANDI